MRTTISSSSSSSLAFRMIHYVVVLVWLFTAMTAAAFVSYSSSPKAPLIARPTTATTTTRVLGTQSLFATNDDDAVDSDDYDKAIAKCKAILNSAAETKTEDADLVVGALEDLEKLMRTKCKAEPNTAPREILQNLNGDWRLIFTTGSAETQRKWGRRVNYFPLKAVQSFQTDEMDIENGIYGPWGISLARFFGKFTFDLKSRKLEFEFTGLNILGIPAALKEGQAAQIGASSGLGSKNNVEKNAKTKGKKKAFFNWISADETIATARGAGGGLALWKRIVADDSNDEATK